MKLTHRRFLGLLNISLVLLLTTFSLAIPVPAVATVPTWSAMNSGTTKDLQDIWGTSGRDVFAVGADGTILHYNGSAWSTMNSVPGQSLYGVWGSSASDVFAVGAGGTIRHYNGSAWSAMNSGVTDYLFSVWGTSSTNVYAVGGGGSLRTILHYDGNTWSPSYRNVGGLFRAVWGSSANNIFVVGDGGVIWHSSNGVAWSAMNSGVTDYLYSVWGTSSTNVYAVGGGGSLQTILHYDGNTWSPSYSDSGSLFRAVWGSSANNIFVVGDGDVIWHSSNGSDWSAMASGVPTTNLSGVWGACANDVFAVGLTGTIIHYGSGCPPTITTITPTSGQWGQTLTVNITGTNFVGVTAVRFGTGIISTFAVNNATQITATISIEPGAMPGARDVSVTAPGGSATLPGAFTVLPLLPPTGAGSGSSSSAGAGAPAQPVVLPTLAVQSATLSAKTVTPGTPVTVTADIANKSAVNGNKKVTLYVNGQVETTQGVAVNSGSSSKLTFNVSRSEPGDYTVYVDGVPAGSFKVELFRESDGILIFSAVLVALAFLIGMVMLRRRQRTA